MAWRGLYSSLTPPVVIGPVVMVIGLKLAQVAVSMATGKAGDQQVVPYGTALSIAAISLLATMLTAIRARETAKAGADSGGRGGRLCCFYSWALSTFPK